MANTLVIGQSGKVIPVDTADLSDYAQLGYTAANERQITDWKRDQALQTPDQQLITGLEAAGSAATFGLSTHAEKAFGVNPEDIAARERLNPIAHGIGTGVGIAAPLLIPGVGEATAPGLIARAGRGVSGAVGTALPEATGLLGRAAAKAAEMGAGSAIEGGLWTTGQVVHEKALNPRLSAENALHTIGLGTILGGALGGALGAATEAVPAAISKAKDVVLGGEEPGLYAKTAGRFFGQEPQTMQDIINAKGRTLQNLEVRAEFSKKFADGLTERIEADKNAVTAYEKHIKPELAKAAPTIAEQTNIGAGHVGMVDDLLAQFGTKGKVDPKKIDSFLRDTIADNKPMDTSVLDNWQTSSNKLHDQIQDAHKYVPTGEYNPESVKSVISKTADLVEDARKQSALAQVADQIGGGGEGSVLQSILGSTVLGHFIPGVGHVIGASLGIQKAASKYLNPTRAAEVLGWFERGNTAAEKALGRSVSNLMKPVGEAIERRAGRTAADIADSFEKNTPELRMLSGNPEELMNRLTGATENFSDHAPTIAQHMQVTAANALSFVASKIPPTMKDGPLGHEIRPTAAAMLKFQKYHDAVNDPLSVIKHPSPEGIETLQTVYPEYLQQARTAILDKVTNARTPPSYQQRMKIADLLGQPADWSMTPMGIEQIQASIAASKTPPMPMGAKDGRPSANKAKSLKYSTHTQTPQQASLSPDRK